MTEMRMTGIVDNEGVTYKCPACGEESFIPSDHFTSDFTPAQYLAKYPTEICEDCEMRQDAGKPGHCIECGIKLDEHTRSDTMPNEGRDAQRCNLCFETSWQETIKNLEEGGDFADGRPEGRGTAAYCPKCAAEIAPNDPAEILDGMETCALCELPKICANCRDPRDESFGRFAYLVCKDCLDEAKAYFARINEVEETLNKILRRRESEGYECNIVFDATMLDRGVHNEPAKRGAVIALEKVPMVFVIMVQSGKGEEAIVDFVPLCPAAVRRMFSRHLGKAARELGISGDLADTTN